MERKEAIEVVKKNYPHCAESGTQFETALRTLIPELCESEDERIKNSLRKCLESLRDEAKWSNFYGSSFESIFAWLERQGNDSYLQEKIESFTNAHKGEDPEDIIAACRGYVKQGEQKPAVFPKFRAGDLVISTKNPHLTYKVLAVGHINETGEPEYKVEIFVDGESANPSNIKYIRIQMMDEWGKLIRQPAEWSEEDEIRLKDALWCVKQATRVARGENDMGTCWGAENWLKDLRLRHHLEPSEWSEEDEVKLNRIVACLENLNIPDNDILLKDVAWLKSIRPQPKQEWSEDDEEEFQIAIDALVEAGQHDSAHWLKSLHPQHHWKPTDEQMADLWNMVCECRPADQQLLQDIYYGLKTLKEE